MDDLEEASERFHFVFMPMVCIAMLMPTPEARQAIAVFGFNLATFAALWPILDKNRRRW